MGDAHRVVENVEATPIDDDDAIEHAKTIFSQSSASTMKNNKKTSIFVHEEMHCQCGKCSTRTNGNMWDFAQDDEIEWNASINSF